MTARAGLGPAARAGLGSAARAGLGSAAAYGPRWAEHGRELATAAAELAAGRPEAAEAILAAIRAATEGCDDAEGRDLRARALHLLAMVADDQGDLAAALALADESLAAGGPATRAATLVNRAQTLERLGRSADALRDLDAAAAAIGDPAADDPAAVAVLDPAAADVDGGAERGSIHPSRPGGPPTVGLRTDKVVRRGAAAADDPAAADVDGGAERGSIHPSRPGGPPTVGARTDKVVRHGAAAADDPAAADVDGGPEPDSTHPSRPGGPPTVGARTDKVARHGAAAADLPAGPAPGAAPEAPAVLVFALHNSRGVSLLSLGRAAEAEAALRRALAVAHERDPGLAGHAHANLAALAARVGDHEAAAQQLGLAAELHALTGDEAAQALALENQARQALGRGDLAAAERGFAAAQEAYERLGRVHDVAGCQVGRAAVALRRARPGAAQQLLSSAVTVLADAGDAAQLTECLLLQGDLTTVVQGFAAGEEVYLAARERCERLGLRHETARVDVRRAMIVAASTRITPRRKERVRRREAALGLVLPAALATDAIRYGFAAGPVRERWARSVAAPALTLAFELVTRLEWTALAFELVEHAAATVTLTPSADSPRLLDADDAFAGHAWAALSAAATDGPGFAPPDTELLALPPRLRMLPSGDGVLDGFIDAAEERYGFPVRSAEVVPAW
ncbi:hypothetical protein [Jiangella sp. DSM 45060]|uniref:hypothetical protein n=1 Tax=Jiangella sp. DSM 45060 TaxID=1798224 RepID=UPI00087DB3B6|nr:hypothetical protein [Jiangella sp. DSM 45060]SDT30754.1 hypothetical protein SAMN04515669_3486 [Jiangella sp. DSM 45060]